jgi:hypothetical protein
MSGARKLASLHERGVAVGLRDGKLTLHGPSEVVGAELRAEVTAQRLELIGYLGREATVLASRSLLTAPLSTEQRRLWFQRALRDDGAMNITMAFRLHSGASPGLAEPALRAVVRRHQMLGALFRELDGEAYMVLPDPPLVPPLRLVDLSALAVSRHGPVLEVMKAEALRPFRLECEPPFRWLLIREADGSCVLQLTRHHIASDGWSLGLILTELARAWAAVSGGVPGAPAHASEYVEYACRQRVSKNDAERRSLLADFRRELGAGSLRMLQGAGAPSGARLLRAVFDDGFGERVSAICRTQRVTPFTLYAGIFAVTLAAMTSRSNVAFGIDVATRDSDELEQCVGTFVNRVPLRLELPSGHAVRDFLQEVKARIARATSCAGIPFEEIVAAANPERGHGYDPLIDVVFGLHAEPRHAMYRDLRLAHAGQAELLEVSDAATVVPLSFYLTEAGPRLFAELRFDVGVVPQGSAERLLSAFDEALRAVVAEGETECASLRRRAVRAFAMTRTERETRERKPFAVGAHGSGSRADSRTFGSPAADAVNGRYEGPFVFANTDGRLNVRAWLQENAALVESRLQQFGAVLLRGFNVSSAERLEACLRTLYGEPMDYRENTSPRQTLRGQIRTSTIHPADQFIELHCEQSYSRRFPLRLLMACESPAESGGETPLADCRRVLHALPAEVRAAFRRRRWRYTRTFVPGFGPNWRETYAVVDREALERYLASADIAWSWQEQGILRTELVRDAEATHPLWGTRVWFNHVLFWHHSSLEPLMAEELLRAFGEHGTPHAVSYGDGGRIEIEAIAAIRAAYWRDAWLHRWCRGDLLILDNMLTAHGRQKFSGARKILFGMGMPIERDSLPALLAEGSSGGER